MAPGAYRRLLDDGVLQVDEDRHVVRPEKLIDSLLKFGPRLIIGDEFRRPAVSDSIRGRAPWATSTNPLVRDHGGHRLHCRTMGHDGALAVTPESRRALRMGLAETAIEPDDDGNVSVDEAAPRPKSRDDLMRRGRHGVPAPWHANRSGVVAVVSCSRPGKARQRQ